MRLVAFVLTAVAAGAQPTYTEAGVVNAASGQPGRFSPNGHASLYGLRLSGQFSPRVVVSQMSAQVLYASPTQVNFVIPPVAPGRVEVWIVVGSEIGPRVRLELLPESPELYAFPGDFAAATHVDGRLVSAEAPARPGQIVVLYGTGFGPTAAGASGTNAPAIRADPVVTPIEVWLDGQPLATASVLYAGVAPGYSGLYQLNLRLPDTLVAEPFIQIGTRGEPSSRTGVRLLARPAP